MNRKYNLKLDLQFRCNNSIMKFNQFDNNTSDFFMRITNGGNLVDIEKAIVVLAIIKPSGKIASQFVEVENGLVYADLKPNMRDEIGTYTAQAMLILEDERVVTDVISYEVEEDKIFSLLNDTVETSEEFTLLTDMLSRLSNIEISEEQRVINEAERILSEENRKIEEAKRVEAELIRQHEEADRVKYDATRESNENIRKQNESIRLANEANRIDEETKRVEEENKRKLAEEERNANYNFMTEDEERRRLEANAHKEAEVLRVQAETNRVNEEAKRRTTEQARVSAENTRVGNENVRKANELSRQNNETKRVEAETQRQNRYNSFIVDAEANANNFENYTNTVKVKEEERKSNELDRKSQEDRRVSNEVERISNENTRKANEVVREKNEASRQNTFTNKVNEVDKKIVELNTTKDNFVSSINTKVDTKISELNTTKDNFVSSVNTKVDNKISELDNAKSDMTNTVSNKVNEVETRFNALTSSQQQDAEVIDARNGEISLKARLDRDVEKAKQVYVNIEGSHISTDSSVGYLKDVEILGNTIQSASNLADIRSVGDKVEGQELYEIPVLSCGKNLFDKNKIILNFAAQTATGLLSQSISSHTTEYIRVKANTNYSFSGRSNQNLVVYDSNYKYITNLIGQQITTPPSAKYIRFNISNADNIDLVQLEEGTQATPYEPYQEDKLTILSPTPLEKVGDGADRIIEKDGVWGVEKNVDDIVLDGNESWKSDPITDNMVNMWLSHENIKANTSMLCDKFIYEPFHYYVKDKECIGNNSNNVINLSLAKSRLVTQDTQGFKQWLQNNNILVKYQTTNPTFIPLPHDQQIKLRTFASKTNISFGCEIEGTIKAQVPKSLGATVNTHTEQINNLNKELDRVKKLEESTVSTVTTESDFTTVEQTTNGYFEDVRLEGKTLVNLATQPTNNGSINHQYATISTVTNIKTSTEYTYIIYNNGSETLKLYLNTNGGFDWFDLDVEANSTVMGKAKTLPTIDGDIWLSLSEAETVAQNLKVVLLEGDHTQNPPNGYIEGLKSVGEDVDEVSVESVNPNGNLFDGTMEVGSISADGKLLEWSPFVRTDYINVKPGVSVFCKVVEYDGITPNIQYSQRLCEYDINKNFIKSTAENKNVVVLSDKTKYIRYSEKIESNDMDRVDLSKVNKLLVCYASSETDYTPYQSDKKRLLYYNNETQAWEKPILRQWDSIEKHANGKYYYHKRSAEVVFDGSEDEGWTKADNTDAGYSRFFNGAYSTPDKRLEADVICDKLPTSSNSYLSGALFDCIGGASGNNRINIKYSGDLTVSDLTNKLSNSPHTVVYQLAQEKVYECTNIDLITYANETNYIVESGAIVPRTTLKVHNNISNVVSLLQKKVSLLESNVTSYMITQNRLMLASRYNADTVSFKVDVASFSDTFEYDNDLYELILNNILVGKDNYNREYIENLTRFYWMDFVISDEMYSTLFEIIEEQHNPKIEEEAPIE